MAANLDRSNWARARSGSRESTITPFPRSSRASTSFEPIRPVAPVTATRTGVLLLSLRSTVACMAGRSLPSAVGVHALLAHAGQRIALCEAHLLAGERIAACAGLLGDRGCHGGSHVPVEYRGDDVVVA
jgi:hypothetical protein